MSVVLDAGIWVSAIGFGGIPALALKKAATIDQIAISDIFELTDSCTLRP